jgi:hypothetical protein
MRQAEHPIEGPRNDPYDLMLVQGGGRLPTTGITTR